MVIDIAVVALKIRAKRFQIVALDAGEKAGDKAHLGRLALGAVLDGIDAVGIDRGQIEIGIVEDKGVALEAFLLEIVDILRRAVRHREDHRDADDADGAGKGDEDRARFFGEKVVEGQRERREEGHGGSAHALVDGFLVFRFIGIGVGGDLAVHQGDDAGRVGLSQLGIVGDHHDQTIACDLLEQIHDLETCLGIQRAGRLVRQKDIGIVYQRTGDRDTLHLTAGKLGGSLVDVFLESDLFERFRRAGGAIFGRNAADRQRELDVFENRLVGDQVVALEYKADRVVAVGIPVAIGILFGGDPVDDQIAVIVAIQSADDIQEGGLTGTAGTEYRYKFVVAQTERHALERFLHKTACLVYLTNLFDLKHDPPPYLCKSMLIQNNYIMFDLRSK